MSYAAGRLFLPFEAPQRHARANGPDECVGGGAGNGRYVGFGRWRRRPVGGGHDGVDREPPHLVALHAHNSIITIYDKTPGFIDAIVQLRTA